MSFLNFESLNAQGENDECNTLGTLLLCQAAKPLILQKIKKTKNTHMIALNHTYDSSKQIENLLNRSLGLRYNLKTSQQQTWIFTPTI